MKPTLRRYAVGWVVPLLLLAGWEYLSRQGTEYSFAFVPLVEAWKVFTELLLDGSLAHHLAATLSRMLTGLCAGTVVGILLGSLLGISSLADKVVGPTFHAIRQVPLLGWVPLFALWFGAGTLSQVLVIFLASLYPVVINTYEGVHYVDKRYREVGSALRFTPIQFFRFVLFPAAFPSIVTGMTHALAFAWLSSIGSELLFGEGTGLGSLMILAETSGRTEILLVCILVIGAIGYLMNHLIRKAGRQVLRWQEQP